MKEKINVFDYSEQIMKALRRGILLNTNGDKFNSMVISWGHFGMIWGEPTFVVYVREHRYTKPQLDKTMEFTLSIPLDKPDPLINKVCGSLSGHQRQILLLRIEHFALQCERIFRNRRSIICFRVY